MRILFATLLLAACGPQTSGTGRGPGGDNPDGGDTGNADLAFIPNPRGGGDGGMQQQSGDMNCGGMSFQLQRVPPNVMLVIDRSGSMTDPISFTDPFTSKWDDLKTALEPVLMQYDAQIQFGADLFSDPSQANCQAGGIAVACGPNHAAQVKQAIDAASPDGNTPTAATLDIIIQKGMLTDTTRDNYVVLATDGLPNCGDTDVTGRITTLYNQTPSVKTFVIGVGSDQFSDTTQLNNWATAGHTDRQGSTKYYPANSPQDLKTAFDTIAGGVVSCTFKMNMAAPDPNQLYVWENGQMVPADPNNGYSYDASGPQVTLHGTACDQVKMNPGTKVQVIYGCSSPPIT